MNGATVKSCPQVSLRNQLVLFAAAVLLAVLARIFVDHPLAQYLDAQPRDFLWWFFREISYLGEGRYWALLGLAAVACRYFAVRRPAARAALLHWYHAGIYLLVTLASSTAVLHLLKLVVGRERPRTFLTTGAEVFRPFAVHSASFPSGHSQTIWAVMTALALLYPRYRRACIIFALLVTLSRLVLLKHFMSDVIIGGWLGAATAYWVSQTRWGTACFGGAHGR